MIFSSIKFHHGEEQAWAVQKETSQNEIAQYEKKICTKLSWHANVPALLEDVLNAKYFQCRSFKDSLDGIYAQEIICADKDRQLGCGMQYAVAVLTPSKKFPRQNILGEQLTVLRNNNNK